jgi:hypothetical protein
MIYHLGPSTINKIIVAIFQDTNAGYCFKYLPNNRVGRFIPLEFIKDTVLAWFEENINMYDLPFDSITEFEDIRKLVTKKYFIEVDKNMERLNKYVEERGLSGQPGFNKNEFFKTMWKDWFGSANIILYNRYVDRTIFK